MFHKKLPLEEQEDKLAELRRLDASVSAFAMAASLALGIVSALIFGVGMCCFLLWSQWLLGTVTCLEGAVGTLFAPQLYNRMVKQRRERIAPEILRLTDELSQK